MTWVSWRLQRTETLITVGILGLVAAFLIPTGIQMANAYHHDGLAACLGVDPGPTCQNALGSFRQRFQPLIDLAGWFTLVPGLIGVLLAVPFTLDLERGTYRLAWTQSITRSRWLAGKLGMLVVAALAAACTLLLLFTWWRAPSVHIDGRLDRGNYDTTGVVVIGYTLFALALALALGAILRRSSAALAVAFVGYFAVRLLVDLSVRDDLVTPLKATYRGAQPPAFLNHAQIISLQGAINGHPVFGGGGFFYGATKFAAPNMNKAVFHVVYVPTSHFWPLQLTETGLFVGLAAILIAFAAWWTNARTG